MGLVNTELLGMAKDRLNALEKMAFVPGGDPSMGGGAPPGGDPAAGGPPPGGDPSGGGGAPPGGGGGGGFDPTSLQPMIQTMVQQAMQQGGGGMGGGMGGAGAASGAPLKPKIDVNVEIMQIKNMLAKLCDAQGIHIPAQDMTATPEKLMAMANGQSPASGAQMGGGGGGAIPPIDPMQGMQGAAPPAGGEKVGSYRNNGRAFDTTGLADVSNRAAAIGRLLNRKKN